MAKKIEMDKTTQKLYNQLRLEVKRANQRLVRLERKYGTNTWASKKLKSRLDTDLLNSWTESGRIKLNKSMSKTQLRAIGKATNNFLKSKTSTVKGVKIAIKNTKLGLRRILENEETLSDEEVETIFDLMSDEYIRDLSEYIPPSDLAVLLQESREKNDSIDDFINRISNYIEIGNDEDFKNKLRIIYSNHIMK